MVRVLIALALACVALTLVSAPAPAVAATTTIKGIDVSHWQGTINWPAVGRDGIRFAFAKATEGTSWVDDAYATNRAGARAAGIRFGAYHFARPGPSIIDARKEADHFVRVAGLKKGDLIPALDLERTGGLTTAQLIDWTRRWVRRVRRLVGEKPVIYTSPTFWRSYLGNTTWFADHGYHVWVARWGRSVRVPGLNWSDLSYTFWQYSDCGSVAGIKGCVDLDRFGRARLKTATLGS
jgi:lysozyme